MPLFFNFWMMFFKLHNVTFRGIEQQDVNSHLHKDWSRNSAIDHTTTLLNGMMPQFY